MRHEVLMRHEVVRSGLMATAWTPGRTVEVAEDWGLPSGAAVQWHPQAGENPSLFEGMVSAARPVHQVRLRGTCRFGTDPDDATAAVDFAA
jgi:hypothetical protein